MSNIHFSSATNEHYTPYDILTRVCDFYGGDIDLDPCSNSLTDPHVPAAIHYTEAMDGLSLPWAGRVFVNPPYGRKLLPAFVAKFIEESKSPHVTDILLLVPARTDTRWHSSLQPYQRCYIRGRLKFHNPANQGNAAPFPSVLFYHGTRPFSNYWSTLGECYGPPPSSDRRTYMKNYMRRRRSNP